MNPKKKSKIEEIESEKSVIIIFPEKQNLKNKKMGLAQNIDIDEEKVVVKLKPMVIEAHFEGDPIQFEIRGEGIGKFYTEILKKFESSTGEVLVIENRKASIFNKKRFNEILKSLIPKMVTKKYMEKLHKTSKKSYVV